MFQFSEKWRKRWFKFNGLLMYLFTGYMFTVAREQADDGDYMDAFFTLGYIVAGSLNHRRMMDYSRRYEEKFE